VVLSVPGQAIIRLVRWHDTRARSRDVSDGVTIG
jgi:hypothetical protein